MTTPWEHSDAEYCMNLKNAGYSAKTSKGITIVFFLALDYIYTLFLTWHLCQDHAIPVWELRDVRVDLG